MEFPRSNTLEKKTLVIMSEKGFLSEPFGLSPKFERYLRNIPVNMRKFYNY